MITANNDVLSALPDLIMSTEDIITGIKLQRVRAFMEILKDIQGY